MQGLTRGPAVGAAVVNWNSAGHLRHCFAGLAAQEIPFARTVVIDNGSSDPPDELPHPCPDNTHYIRLPCNVGFAKANNIALEHLTDCEWVALVNPDAFLESEWLGRMFDAATRHPTFSYFASRLVMADREATLDGLGDVYHASGLVWREGYGLQVDECTMSEREVFSPCAAAALYRRDALLGVGGFDEDFFCYVEDVDRHLVAELAGRGHSVRVFERFAAPAKSTSAEWVVGDFTRPEQTDAAVEGCEVISTWCRLRCRRRPTTTPDQRRPSHRSNLCARHCQARDREVFAPVPRLARARLTTPHAGGLFNREQVASWLNRPL